MDKISNILKTGGFNSDINKNITKIKIGEYEYSGGGETEYWLNDRKSKIEYANLKSDDDVKKLMNELYESKIPTTYGTLYKYILDNSSVSDGLIIQLNNIIMNLRNLEKSILFNANKTCANTLYISLPELYKKEKIINKFIKKKNIDGINCRYAIDSDLIYYPETLYDLINDIIDYINSFNFGSLVKEKINIKINKFENYKDMNKLESKIPILSENGMEALTILFSAEIEISKYIQKLENYFNYIIEQLNIILSSIQINTL